MKRLILNNMKRGVIGILAFCFTALVLPAEDILFIGNSFTYGGGDLWIVDHGGIPKLVEAIAASKGKIVSTAMVVAGGKDWGFHLQNPPTSVAIKAKPWNWVVLQDYSTQPTHVGNVAEFMKNGVAFYDRITKASPQANIVLFETWPLGAKNAIYSKNESTPQGYANPDEMVSELHKNYAALQEILQGKQLNRQVLVAPVGTAFAHSLREHPEINLYAPDYKHADREGSYLAALVIYATLFHDSPRGASWKFSGFTLDAPEAKKLQSVAEEVTLKRIHRS